ncbi:chemosensory receptor c [Plakobranchus ocellatus]|uniref:Chemosensory receptor c n=1 Tax=Plakobranchus ocellatus TaxID=259542 RepID=A0AAV4CXB2_9GAST|nr:chemosensory receptor c [Plakobranchus ocellatus]
MAYNENQTTPRSTEVGQLQPVLAGLLPFGTFIVMAQSAACANCLVSLFGIATNTLNLKTFVAMGGVFTDGVALTFFTLSISDLGFCVWSLCWSGSSLCFVLEKRFVASQLPYYFPVDPRAMGFYSYIMMVIFGTTTTLITVYLAVMRCLCVVHPLAFRGSLSPRKAGVLFALFLAFSVATRIPIISSIGIRATFDLRWNVTRPGLWSQPNKEQVKDGIRSGVDVPLPIVAEVILTVCIIVMTNALRASTQFRNQSTTSSIQTSGQAHTGHSELTRQEDDQSSKNGRAKSKGLSPKDARVVKQLVILSLLFIVCNIPKLARTLADALEPEFMLGRRYENFYEMSNQIHVLAETFNSTLNFFNTKFRLQIIPHKVCGGQRV